MNREVHFDFTRDWALLEGFTEEEAARIAAANWGVDLTRGRGLLNKRFHFGLLGAPVVSWRRYRSAVRDRDLVALGEALHALQDTIGHGVLGHLYHWHGIDRWEHRGPGVRRRLERTSRAVLAAYRRGVSPSRADVPVR